MRRLRIISAPLCVFLVVLALSGCGGQASSNSSSSPASPSGSPAPTPAPAPAPTPTPTPTPQPAPTPSKFIYGVVGFEPDGNGPQGGQINSSTGTVSPVPGAPFDCGLGQSDIVQLIADPKGRFIYTLHEQASAAGMPLGQAGIGEQKIDQQ